MELDPKSDWAPWRRVLYVGCIGLVYILLTLGFCGVPGGEP